jgi:hypothetical protein
MTDQIRGSKEYEAPVLTVLGSVHELTLQNKDLGHSDGLLFQGASIMNVSG